MKSSVGPVGRGSDSWGQVNLPKALVEASRPPVKMVSSAWDTVMLCLVKVATQSASQSWPMERSRWSMLLKRKALVASAGRPGSGRVPTEVERMEVPLASKTEMGLCWVVTLERHAVVEGKK